ncbi:MAG: hypothetical protein R3E31_03460 [Chloroflexota bacterium]
MKRAPGREQAMAWTAFQAFNEGAFLIYAGQESENTHTPDLFDIDKVKWGSYSLQSFLTRLCRLKKDPVQMEGQFTLLQAQPALSAMWQAQNEGLFGAFNVAGVVDVMPTPPFDGVYVNLLDDRPVEVRAGEMAVPEKGRYPVLLRPN